MLHARGNDPEYVLAEVQNAEGKAAPSWRMRPYNRQWLRDQAEALFEFFQFTSVNPRGGFFDLDERGQPIQGSLRQIHSTARMVHCFAIGSLLGRPGSDAV